MLLECHVIVWTISLTSDLLCQFNSAVKRQENNYASNACLNKGPLLLICLLPLFIQNDTHPFYYHLIVNLIDPSIACLQLLCHLIITCAKQQFAKGYAQYQVTPLWV